VDNVDKIDTSGMSCPQPVLMTKKGIEKSPEGVDVIVDNNVARENVESFLKHSGYNVSIKELEDSFLIEARK
jgi:tRNA 2-thiouridine synthesizing protein A